MFGSRWQLMRLFGIPLYLDASWLIILALFSWTLSTYYSAELPGLRWADYWIMGLISAVAFFTCIILHEMGHALVARASGMPVRGITLFLFGGVAELGGEPPSAWREFLTAIAGPIVSLVLAGLFWLGASLGIHAEWPLATVLVLDELFRINLTVLAFNMIPAFPLDGGRVLRSAIWGMTNNLQRATYWAALLGQSFAWILILMGIWQFFLGNFVGGMWMGLIGLFLRNAAQGGYQHVVIRQALGGEPVRHFMNTKPIVVPPTLDLRHWVEDYVYRHHRKCFPVASNGHLEGVVTTRDLGQYPRDEWSEHTVAEVMHRDLDAVTIPPEADALAALSKMERTGSSRLLVAEGNHLVGIVSLKDLFRFLQLKLRMETAEE